MSDKDKKDKQTEAWNFWLSTLSNEAKDALNNKEPQKAELKTKPIHDYDDCSENYSVFRNCLSLEAKEALDKCNAELSIENEIDTSTAKFGIVECPDGEWGMMRLYKTVEGLAKRVGQLENTDIVIWCFFGLPIQLTMGLPRYLLLPGGEKAVQIPLVPEAPCKIVSVDSLKNIEIQDDGFIGPPELANTKIVQSKLEANIKKPVNKSNDEADEANVD